MSEAKPLRYYEASVPVSGIARIGAWAENEQQACEMIKDYAHNGGVRPEAVIIEHAGLYGLEEIDSFFTPTLDCSTVVNPEKAQSPRYPDAGGDDDDEIYFVLKSVAGTKEAAIETLGKELWLDEALLKQLSVRDGVIRPISLREWRAWNGEWAISVIPVDQNYEPDERDVPVWYLEYR